MFIFHSNGRLYPIDHSLGAPELVWHNWHIPLVPTSYRKASCVRLRLDIDGRRKDYALLDGHIFDFTTVLVKPTVDSDGNLVIKRFNGEEVGIIPLIKE